MRTIWLTLLASVVALGAEERRTWTFSEDGEMRCPSGGTWSFKKNGRLDAVFVALEGTNVVLLAQDVTRRIIHATSLSENDRDYLKNASGAPEWQTADVAQRATVQRTASMRTSEAARLRADAASKRRLAQRELEEADRLDNEAARLGSRTASLEAQADHRERSADRVESSATVSPRAGLAYVEAKSAASVKTAAAGRLEDNFAQLRREAAEKRANAARLTTEAADFEYRARSLEFAAGPH